ncbi:hypothetical protein, partial [Salmonella enterica]|uniref:hypothetical protein n=1 Tax=Salmonella enterica TaxID=28901 RepID=UPI003EDBBC40
HPSLLPSLSQPSLPLRTRRVVELAAAPGKVRYIRALINDNYTERCPVPQMYVVKDDDEPAQLANDSHYG